MQEKETMYESPEIVEVGSADEMTLGNVPGDMDSDNCDRTDGDRMIFL